MRNQNRRVEVDTRAFERSNGGRLLRGRGRFLFTTEDPDRTLDLDFDLVIEPPLAYATFTECRSNAAGVARGRGADRVFVLP